MHARPNAACGKQVPYAPVVVTSASNVLVASNTFINSSCEARTAELAYNAWFRPTRPINVYSVSQALIFGNTVQALAGCSALNTSLPVAAVGGLSANVSCC